MSYYNIRNMKYQNCNSQRMFAHAISFLLHQEPYITALKCEIKPSTHLACSRVQMFFTLPMLVASNSTRKPVSTLISKIITNNTWSTVALLNYSVIPPLLNNHSWLRNFCLETIATVRLSNVLVLTRFGVIKAFANKNNNNDKNR